MLMRAMRHARCLSQRELAARAELPKNTVGRLEAGRTLDPMMSTFERIVAAAGYRIAILPPEAPAELVADEITCMECPGIERDASGRHFPAHLERRRLTPETGWWGWGRIAWEFSNHPRPANVYYLREKRCAQEPG